MATEAPAGNPFPPIDFIKFTWQRSDEDQDLYTRSAAGGEIIEDFFTRFAVGEQNLFLGITVQLRDPIPAPAFAAFSRGAWGVLRHKIPSIAAHIEYDAEGNPLITYHVPRDHAEHEAHLKHENDGKLPEPPAYEYLNIRRTYWCS